MDISHQFDSSANILQITREFKLHTDQSLNCKLARIPGKCETWSTMSEKPWKNAKLRFDEIHPCGHMWTHSNAWVCLLDMYVIDLAWVVRDIVEGIAGTLNSNVFQTPLLSLSFFFQMSPHTLCRSLLSSTNMCSKSWLSSLRQRGHQSVKDLQRTSKRRHSWSRRLQLWQGNCRLDSWNQHYYEPKTLLFLESPNIEDSLAAGPISAMLLLYVALNRWASKAEEEAEAALMYCVVVK